MQRSFSYRHHFTASDPTGRCIGFGNRRTWRVADGRPPPSRLAVGRFDDVDGLAAYERPGGVLRPWLATDDDDQRPFRTLLVALDMR
ncbi:MAG TPA: hypothetical protein VM346_10960 [Sphingomicrobium sp.]|nr:hypothetical protein [Sphingomicrobium sp.]